MSEVVRQAAAGDVPHLVELRAEMFAAMGQPTSGRWRVNAAQWFEDAIDDPDICILVIDDSGRLLSSAMAELHHGAPAPNRPTGVTAHVSNVVTTAEARGRGHADRLVSELLRWCAEDGRADRVSLFATGSGRGIYQRYGFTDASFPAMRLSLIAPPDVLPIPESRAAIAENRIIPLGDGGIAITRTWYEEAEYDAEPSEFAGGCEFCGADEATRLVRFTHPSEHPLLLPRELSACEDCYRVIAAGDVDQLTSILVGNPAWQDVGVDAALKIVAEADASHAVP